MITFRQKGDFSKLTRFLEKAKETVGRGDLDRYGREGVAALASATPIDSGLTASFIIQIFKMEFQSQSLFNMVTELEQEAGYRGEIISIPLSSLFLIGLQMMCGRRLLSHEQYYR